MPFIVIAIVVLVVLLALRTNQKTPPPPNLGLKPPTDQPPAPSQAGSIQRKRGDQFLDSGVLAALLPPQFVMLDLETTGLNPLRDEIIEFGAIKVSLNSDKHPSFHTLVKPSCRLPGKIVEITGITQRMVDDEGIELKDALSDFIVFVGNLPIVTYNADFDMGFIHNAAKICGVVVENKYACALKRARRAWPGLPSYKLAYISELMSLSENDQHRALADCQRAVTVFLNSTVKLNRKVRWTTIGLA